MEVFVSTLRESWHVLQESAGFMLLGFFIAGMLKAFLPDDFVGRHLGLNRTASVVKAALLGIPIPLCSCGVTPAAAGLRRQGAGKGATAAFLVATPETGVDSIAITYALLDPVMTLLRPLAAFITATSAGLLIDRVDRKDEDPVPRPPETGHSPCGCATKRCTRPLAHRFAGGISFAFGELMGDIGLWFLGGVVLAGMITALVPQEFVEDYLGGGFSTMLVMLAVGIPMYVCASASTPIAAALALKGVSPGAALVFLLAGPATNAASLSMIAAMLGRKATGLYLATIACCALGMGIITNYVYDFLGIEVTEWIQQTSAHDHGMYSNLFAVMVLLLIAVSVSKKVF